MEFRNSDDGDDTTCNLDSHWTAYNAWWSPFDKGDFTRTYKISSSGDGEMTYYVPLALFDPTLVKIVATDYNSYILGYHCE